MRSLLCVHTQAVACLYMSVMGTFQGAVVRGDFQGCHCVLHLCVGADNDARANRVGEQVITV